MLKWIVMPILVVVLTGCANSDAEWDRLHENIERLERGTSELEQGLQAGSLKDDVTEVKEAIKVVKDAVRGVVDAESTEAKIAEALRILEEQKSNIPYGETAVPVITALAAMFGLNKYRNMTREARLAPIESEKRSVTKDG